MFLPLTNAQVCGVKGLDAARKKRFPAFIEAIIVPTILQQVMCAATEDQGGVILVPVHLPAHTSANYCDMVTRRRVTAPCLWTRLDG
jgi:hypothetical protein